jgi:hypothetical protein
MAGTVALLTNRDGWVPVRFLYSGREPLVDWCWLGSDRFIDPFFDHTIEAAQAKPFNRLFMHRTPMDELGRWYRESPGMEPSGFIFHMSRCGSTLVSRMLAAPEENVVISEAGPLDRLARAFAIPESTREQWLRWMVSALGQKRGGRETRYFIKFDSPTVLALPFIRRAFPAVPWIFLYRNPEEVLVSHLREPAAAMSRGTITDICAADVIGAPWAEIASMSAEEYAARVVGQLCRSAVTGMDARGLAVNYTQLPEAVCGEIERHFGVAFSPDEIERMRDLATYHAKRPRQRFEADGQSKRLEVSDPVREAAARWIWPHYEELASMKCCTSSPPIRRKPRRS